MDQKIINPYRLFVGSFLPNWLMTRQELMPSAKIVYARLCQYAGKNGKAFPSQFTLGRELGITDRQTRRCLKQLEDFKLIKTVRSGKRMNNHYLFLDHPWMYSDDELEENDTEKLSTGGQKCPVTKGGDRTHMSGSDRTHMSGPYKRESYEENHTNTLCVSTRFENFWSSIPSGWRREDKKKCFQLFKKINPDDQLLDKMTEAMVLQESERQKLIKNRQWVPNRKMVKTWISQRSWENEILTEKEIQNDYKPKSVNSVKVSGSDALWGLLYEKENDAKSTSEDSGGR
jgi:hypothetical protein